MRPGSRSIVTLAADPAATVVDAGAIERGIALADWFARETERVYELFNESDEDRELRQLAEWIGRRGGTVTVRDLTHGRRRYCGDSAAAEAALEKLVAGGVGRWVVAAPGRGGGRPPKRFELVTRVTVTETPPGATDNGGFGDGDTGDGSNS